MVDLPPNKIATTFFASPRCAVCGREWEQGATPVPTVYTVASFEAELPPEPVCDYCVEEHDPELFEELLAERRRFYAS
ncbi:MAG: hypothetical protein QOJ97_859 [Solirubrobacteraceae bacterium]|jgi:hypothetical protein|nr:hypothetical protein [Solirubrobacteraceae bacterium]